jgi:hypothetical protein
MAIFNFPDIEERTQITADSLNDTFAELAPTGLNADNLSVNPVAIDLGQLTATQYLTKYVESFDIGLTDWYPDSSFGSVTSSGAGAPTPTVITNSTISFGLGGKLLAADDLLKIYLSMNVNPLIPTTITSVAGLGQHEYYAFSGSPIHGHDNFSAHVLYLEWDTTSSSLTNWTPVPGQQAFNTAYTIDGSTYYGCPRSKMMGAMVAQAWLEFHRDSRISTAHGFEVGVAHMKNRPWRGSTLMYVRPTDTGNLARIIYGIRVVGVGVVHPVFDGTTSAYVIDKDAQDSTIKLLYLNGRMTVEIKKKA